MVRSVHDFARYNSDTHYAQHSNNRRTTVPGRQHFRPVTKFTVFCNSQSVTLCRTYLKTVFFFLTAQCLRVYQASCRCCWWVYQDATFQTNLILPHHASPEICPVQRRKFFRCVTGNLLSSNVYSLLIFSIRLIFYYWY